MYSQTPRQWQHVAAAPIRVALTRFASRHVQEGLRLQPSYAQLYHAWAKLEGRLLNWQVHALLVVVWCKM